MAGTVANPIGITNPPIDELLATTDSKYSLVIYAAKRARQINAYYSQLGEGLLEYVGPLVETAVQEKPLSIALREINGGLLTPRAGRRPGRLGRTPVAGPASSSAWPGASRRTRRASCSGSSPRPGTTSGSCRPPARWSSSARRPGRPCPATP